MTTEAHPAKPVYEAVRDPRPHAMVVYCSDPRFQPAFEKFIEQELKLAKGQYVPVVIGGGAGVLAYPEQLPKEFKFLRERFEFYRKLFPTAKRIVLLSHEDCRYYDSLKQRVIGFGQPLRAISQNWRDDLGLVSKVFTNVLAHLGLSVELYYAKFADAEHTKVTFEKTGTPS